MDKIIPKVRGKGYNAYYDVLNTKLRSEVRRLIKERVKFIIFLTIRLVQIFKTIL